MPDNLVDVANLFISATEKIEFYWNFYVGTILVLLGWLISRSKPLSKSIKLIVTFGYLCFVTLNILALTASYSFAEALRKDLLAVCLECLPNTRAILTEHTFEFQQKAVYWIHGLFGLGVIGTIWLGSFGKQNNDNH